MKIGIFSDSHYSSKEITCNKRYNSRSLVKIKEAYTYFQKEECALIVCLGDLIDTEATEDKVMENLSAIAKVVESCPIKTVALMGNHDAFSLSVDTFYETLGIPKPTQMSLEGRNLLFLDACYFQNGHHYAPGESGWKDTFYPYEDEFKATLGSISGDTYVFVHQNIDPKINEDHRIFNADALFEAINESRIVKTVFQGHYHPGACNEYEGVKYVTLPAMCENEGAYFVFEI